MDETVAIVISELKNVLNNKIQKCIQTINETTEKGEEEKSISLYVSEFSKKYRSEKNIDFDTLDMFIDYFVSEGYIEKKEEYRKLYIIKKDLSKNFPERVKAIDLTFNKLFTAIENFEKRGISNFNKRQRIIQTNNNIIKEYTNILNTLIQIEQQKYVEHENLKLLSVYLKQLNIVINEEDLVSVIKYATFNNLKLYNNRVNEAMEYYKREVESQSNLGIETQEEKLENEIFTFEDFNAEYTEKNFVGYIELSSGIEERKNAIREVLGIIKELQQQDESWNEVYDKFNKYLELDDFNYEQIEDNVEEKNENVSNWKEKLGLYNEQYLNLVNIVEKTLANYNNPNDIDLRNIIGYVLVLQNSYNDVIDAVKNDKNIDENIMIMKKNHDELLDNMIIDQTKNEERKDDVELGKEFYDENDVSNIIVFPDGVDISQKIESDDRLSNAHSVIFKGIRNLACDKNILVASSHHVKQPSGSHKKHVDNLRTYPTGNYRIVYEVKNVSCNGNYKNAIFVYNVGYGATDGNTKDELHVDGTKEYYAIKNTEYYNELVNLLKTDYNALTEEKQKQVNELFELQYRKMGHFIRSCRKGMNI